jgi:methyl-accepting chemotaxis protein
MNVQGRMLVTWSLRKKLYFSFGSVIALVAVLGAVVYTRLRESDRLSGEQARYQHIALDAQTLYTLLIQLRRHEKDFFLRDGDAAAETAHQRRREQAEQELQVLRTATAESRGEMAKRLSEVSSAYAKYVDAFNAAIAAFKAHGNYDSGLQLEFRNAAHELEQLASGDAPLTIALLQMRRAEKDFLLRDKPEYADKVRTSLADARKLSQKLEPAAGARFGALLDEYRAKFDAAQRAGSDLDVALKGLHDTTEQCEELLAAFVDAAIEDAAVADRALQSVQQTTELLLLIAFLLTLMIALAVARLISTQVSSSIGDLMAGTRSLGQGNLRARVDITARDELGELGVAFNQMAGSLREMATNIGGATGSMEDVVRELQATVSEQGAALQQQASSVSETVATVGELSRSADQVSEVARRVLEEADRSVQSSKRGLDAIQQSVQGMTDVREQVQNIATTILDLSERTQQIGSIIATVDDFAERSSLLALNASIEAARAGEAGKAFSVVAGEVKNLAEQSQQATEKVRSILSDIQRTTHTAVMVTEEGSKRVDRGVELVTSAGDIIATLAGAISSSADSAKQIAAAARQQNNGIEQISVAMAGIEQFSKQNVEATRQTEGTAQTLAAVSKQLRSTTAQYQV